MKEQPLKSVTWTPNPIIDITLMIPLIEIPSKQEKYKKIFHNIYLKKSVDKNKKFETLIKEKLSEEKSKEWPLTGLLEVFISITAKKSRINKVDIDNLLKSILDCLNGVVYKDDSQIIQVIGRKFTSEDISVENSLMIAIRKSKDHRDLKFTDFTFGAFSNPEYK
ncbi:MAG: RusA family crossover junction endodeoxyribonuclease [Bacteroidetes bacterium]|nr:RusA family crossover junction endodeoxyribonuclease [Bacteroidota bacterium]